MVGGVVMAVLGGFLPPAGASQALDGSQRPPPDRRVILTPDGPSYHYRRHGDGLVIRARSSRGEPNRREVLTDTRVRRNQTICATWATETNRNVQPGLAVRVTRTKGRVRAVTLTKNIVYGLNSVFNVASWDTARRGHPWRKVAQFDLADVVLRPDGKLRALPWRACVRVVGLKLALKIWLPRRSSEPSWSDPIASRHTRLPRSLARAGRSGWYVGHLPNRGRLIYHDLEVRR